METETLIRKILGQFIIRDFSKQNSLKIVPHGSTLFTSTSETFIDLIMVYKNDSIVNFKSFKNINDHYLIDEALNLLAPNSNIKNITNRDIKNLDINSSLHDL